MRRIELFFGIATAALTVWAIAAMLWVPVGVTTLTTPTRTTTTYSYALDQGIGPVVAYIALFSVLAARRTQQDIAT